MYMYVGSCDMVLEIWLFELTIGITFQLNCVGYETSLKSWETCMEKLWMFPGLQAESMYSLIHKRYAQDAGDVCCKAWGLRDALHCTVSHFDGT